MRIRAWLYSRSKISRGKRPITRKCSCRWYTASSDARGPAAGTKSQPRTIPSLTSLRSRPPLSTRQSLSWPSSPTSLTKPFVRHSRRTKASRSCTRAATTPTSKRTASENRSSLFSRRCLTVDRRRSRSSSLASCLRSMRLAQSSRSSRQSSPCRCTSKWSS